jgi:hypothetical protein
MGYTSRYVVAEIQLFACSLQCGATLVCSWQWVPHRLQRLCRRPHSAPYSWKIFSRPRIFAESLRSRPSAKSLPRAHGGPSEEKSNRYELTDFQNPFADGRTLGLGKAVGTEVIFADDPTLGTAGRPGSGAPSCAECPVQVHSAQLGTPEKGSVSPGVPSVLAQNPRQRWLCRRPRSAKRSSFVYFFLLPNCNQMHITCKHTYITCKPTCSSTYHIYITSTSSHITILHTSTSSHIHTSPQVHKST